jgi:hypothetical protein
MGSAQDVTIGEIHRAVTRIERKVDDQGETIHAVNLRLTAIEAQQTPGSRVPKAPVAAGAGLGAILYGAAQWLMSHWGKAVGP